MRSKFHLHTLHFGNSKVEMKGYEWGKSPGGVSARYTVA